MKKLFLILFTITFSLKSLDIKLEAQQNEKMKLLIGLVGKNSELDLFSQNLKNDLEFTGQFEVIVEKFEQLKSKKEIADLANNDFLFALFVSKSSNSIVWRLYDTYQVSMIKGKKISANNISLNALAHKIVDELLPDLTGRDGSFFSMISACKRIKKGVTHLHAFHPTEFVHNISKSEPIVTEPTTVLLSKWHPSKLKLFFSKHSKYNVKLASVDTKKQKSLVANFDGINMPPAFSKSGRIVIPVTIDGKGRLFEYSFDSQKQKGVFKPLTKSNIHAVSPSFIDEENIVFCSIDEFCKPRIAILKKNNIEYLNLTGVCPTYCDKNKLIAFCKKEDSHFQVFTYNMNTKELKQLTKCKSDKDGCSWSPCGNFVVYSSEVKNKCRIQCLNIWTNDITNLTPESEHWSSPSWSPIYNEIPFYKL